MPQAKKQVFFSQSALFRRSSRRLSHPPPHRTAAKRHLHAFRAVFPARVFSTVLLTRPHTAPRRKGICTLFAPLFSPAYFPPSFPPAPAPHRGEKAFARFSHRFSRPWVFHRPSHPVPHRTAPRRKGVHLIFAPFFPPASFSPSFPPAPASYRGEKAFA